MHKPSPAEIEYERHTHAIYTPAIVEEIRTAMCWTPQSLGRYKSLQRTCEPKLFSSELGQFASQREYWFYRMVHMYSSAYDNCILLSNIPLADIFSVDEVAFDAWFTAKRFFPVSRKNSLDAFRRLIGGKIVDLIIVDRATGILLTCVEIDGPQHLNDNPHSDLCKNYLFRQHGMKLLRISTDKVCELWTGFQGGDRKENFAESMQSMERNWEHFVEQPSVETMHIHFNAK